MPTVTQAVQAFLTAFTHADLASLYNSGMEVQVNVAQDDGDPISQKSGFTGRIWRGYTDGIQTWKPIRIPYGANTDDPHYTDKNLNWDLSQHAEGIGMTGWCWEHKVSKWVGFDFDDLTGHSEGLTATELKEVQEMAVTIPWVTVRRSTGGHGLHLYVFVNDIPTTNHTEHAALGRAILGKMTATTGFEFSNKVDICGGNMWVWHRKMKGTKGLELIKQGDILTDIPINWKDHIPVISGKRRRSIPSVIEKDSVSLFEQLTGERPHIKLDDDHKKLLTYLEEMKSQWWYDSDNNLLVCHTSDLKSAHSDLQFRGLFETVATGKDKPDHNCFSGETEVMTSTGTQQIKDLATAGHATLYVLTDNGMQWIDCKIKSFGYQDTVPVKVNGETLRATLNHDWLYFDNDSNIKKCTTSELHGKDLVRIDLLTLLNRQPIQSIDFNDKLNERVYCAVVPQWHNFTLANGVITGNCFCYPEEYPKGSWVVRRFSQGITEANTWSQDSAGWTRCWLNKEPSLSVAARAFDGIEDEKGSYFFNEAEVATAAVSTLGANLNLPNWAGNRQTIVKSHKDGQRLVVAVKREASDNPSQMIGWKEDKGWWKRIFNAKLAQPESSENQDYDSMVRHLLNPNNSDAGWVIRTGNKWQSEPLVHIKAALKSFGLNELEINKAIGKCILESWILVNKPFEDEYPGNREWNREAVQLQYVPKKDEPHIHPNWDKLINHCGSGLDSAVQENGWCQANGILTGGDYLRLWIASIFQYPMKHLPYLFLYSPEQQTGKTSFHEALKLLITPNGYMDVKAAMLNSQGFNEEMKSAVICAVDEMDLRQNKYAYNRIKDWITSSDILIHPKGKTPYMIKNVTHFIHTGNDANECPITTNDSRIVVVRVPPLNPIEMIPESVFKKLLDKEAPDFLGTLFKTEIPPCQDRLNIPILETEEKDISAKLNRNALEIFIDEYCFFSPGDTIKYSDFWNQFQNWLDPNEVSEWSKIRMGRSLPLKHPKGRVAADGANFHIANISFTKPVSITGKQKLVLQKDFLVWGN